jgi:DnaJ-class molecular chaperone
MSAQAAQAKPDYYGILGVSRESSGPEIKAAFVKLTAVFHGAGKPKNIADVEEIREYVTGYRVLSDPTKRAYYDRTGLRPLETKLAGGLEPVASEEQTKSFRHKLGEVASGLETIWGLLELFS